MNQGTRMHVLVAINSVAVMHRLISIIHALEETKTIGYVSRAPDAVGLISIIVPDLLILEVQLRESSGFEVLKHIKAHSSRATVVMVTDDPYTEYKKACLDLGADFFFNLAREFEDFCLTVKRLSREISIRQTST